MVGTEIVWSVATSAGVEEFLEEGEASRTGGVPQLTATAEAEAGAEKVRRHEEESSTAIVIQTVPVDEYDTDTVTATTTASKGTAKPPPPGDKEKPTESKTGAEPPEETGAAGRLEGGKAVWGAAVAAVLGALGVAFM